MIAAPPSSPQTAAYTRLRRLVDAAEAAPRPRTEADEDRLALEDMIWLKEGALPLMRYRRLWRCGR
jgi:hypothetical protein